MNSRKKLAESPVEKLRQQLKHPSEQTFQEQQLYWRLNAVANGWCKEEDCHHKCGANCWLEMSPRPEEKKYT